MVRPIIVERVSNGWLIRPELNQGYATVADQMAVAETVPALMEWVRKWAESTAP